MSEKETKGMSDFKITWIGANYATDVTATLSGQPQGLREEEKTEMTNWEKFDAFWDMVLKAQIRRDENADNR